MLDSKTPALESNSASKFVASRIKSIGNAKKFYIEAEYSERIPRALMHIVRNVKQHFQAGNCVYFRRNWNAAITLNYGIIDTVCASSVCGAVSFDMFIRTLPADLTAETIDQIHNFIC